MLTSNAIFFSLFTFAAAIGSVWGGIVLFNKNNLRLVGILLTLLGWFFGSVLLPEFHSNVNRSHGFFEFSGGLVELLQQVAPVLLAIVGLLTLYPAFLLFTKDQNLEVLRGTTNTNNPASQPWRGVLALLIAAGALYGSFEIFQMQPSEVIRETVEMVQEYDEAFPEADDKFDAEWSRSSRIKAAITFRGQWLSATTETGLKSLLEERNADLEDTDEFFGLKISKINSVDYFSRDGKTWTHAVVYYDATLEANPKVGRTEEEKLTDAHLRFNNSEKMEALDEKMGELMEELETLIRKAVKNGGTTASNGTGGNLFPSSSGFGR